jgi:hypothetical protein
MLRIDSRRLKLQQQFDERCVEYAGEPLLCQIAALAG